ncbi:CARDB domain-containing protein [bacterium]
MKINKKFFILLLTILLSTMNLKAQTYNLTIDTGGTGTGSIWVLGNEYTTFPTSIAFGAGTMFVIRAEPDPYSTWDYWTGSIIYNDAIEFNYIISSDMSLTANFTGWPDLTGQNVGFGINYCNRLDIMVTVKNIGVTITGPCHIGYYLSSDANLTTSDYRIGEATCASLAVGGQNQIVNFFNLYTVSTVPPLPQYSTHTYYPGLIIDYKDEVSEIDETNNIKIRDSMPITFTRGIVADFSASPTSGPAPLTVQFTDQSIGEVNNYSWDFGDGYPDASANPAHTYLTAGTYTVILNATGCSTSDTKISQNCITVTDPQGLPDLIVQSIEILDGEGPDISYKVTVRNLGSGATTGEFKNRIYLSTDNIITSDDVQINDWNCYDMLAASQSKTSYELTSTVTELPPGEYYLGVIADGKEVIIESNESNNTGCNMDTKISIPEESNTSHEKSPSVQSFHLAQNIPNPFNPSTTIRYGVAKSCPVTLIIYDLHGKEVETLVDESGTAGEYSVIWNGQGHAAGIYLARFTAGEFTETRKLILYK